MAQEAPKTSWIYHPLDGQELLKWVFADAWPKLKEDGQFGANLVYHNPKYTMRLEITAYDGGKAATNGAVAVYSGEMYTSGTPLPAETEQKEIKLGSEVEQLKEPDKARETIDEGRYKIVNEGGVLVDKKVKKGDKK